MAHEGFPLHLLDPLDAVLDLATRIAERSGHASLVSGRRNLLAAATTPSHALRLDRLLDLRTHVEKNHASMQPEALVGRAAEWSAEPALCAALECLQMGLGFRTETRAWVRHVARELARRSGAHSTAQTLFRPDPIERLPQWAQPSNAYLAWRYAIGAGGGPRALKIARARHLAGLFRTRNRRRGRLSPRPRRAHAHAQGPACRLGAGPDPAAPE